MTNINYIELIKLFSFFALGVYFTYFTVTLDKSFKESKEDKETNTNKKLLEEKRQALRDSYPKDDFRHYKNPEKMLKEVNLYYNEAKENVVGNMWTEKVLKDGVMEVFKNNCQDEQKFYFYTMVSEHYVMQYWHVNIPYNLADDIVIQSRKNGETLYHSSNNKLTVKNKLLIYYIEKDLLKGKKTGNFLCLNEKQDKGEYSYSSRFLELAGNVKLENFFNF